MKKHLFIALLVLCVQAVFANGILEEKRAQEYDALTEQANACLEADDYAAAIPLLKRIHELRPGELAAVEWLGISYMYLPEERPEFANALFWLAEAEKRGSSYSFVYYQLACVYSLKGELEKAEAVMNKALALGYSNFKLMSRDDDLVNFRTGPWWKGIADNSTQIERLLDEFDEYDEDEESIEDRITFYSGIVTALKELAPHIPALQSRPLFYLASSYEDMGDYVLAEKNYFETKAIREKALGKEHPYYAVSLNNLGSLYQAMGDYARAERYSLEAAAIREKALGKEHPEYATSLNNLGVLYQAMGDYVKAEAYNKELCELRIKLINQNVSFMSKQQFGLYLKTVLQDFEASYSLSRLYPVETVNSLNYTNTLFTKGLLLRTTNAIRDAVYSSGDTALIGKFEQLGRLRRQISTLRQKEGSDETYLQSLETQSEALDKELTRASANFRDLKADMAMQWQAVRDSLQPGEAAIEFVSFRVYDKKWTDTVQYAALVLKPGSKAPAWVPLCEEGELQAILNKVEGRGYADIVKTERIYDTFGADLYSLVWEPLEQELNGISTIYYSPSALLHKLAFGALPTGEDAFDDAAGEDDDFEEFEDKDVNRLADKYDLNLVSSTRELVRLSRDQTRAAISSAVLYGGLDYNASAEAMREAAQPYREDGITSSLPEWLSRGWGWNLLPSTREEALTIQGYLDRKKIPNTLYMGSAGNEESFKSLDGKRTGLIYLATHGFFIADVERRREERTRSNVRFTENPMLRSGIILAGANNAWTNRPVEGVEDGILLADEIANLNLYGTKLAVLSTDQSGLGAINRIEGVYGLQRAFKLAGVETLIMSLWEVDAESSAKLMSVFLQEWLFSGKSRQEAFKEAQRHVRAEYPEPYHWAAFVMLD